MPQVPEIKITPEMIEAGWIVYASCFLELRYDETQEISKEMVKRIYLTMEMTRRLWEP
jgi:hypothetical protein